MATIGLGTATALLQAANDRERKAKENEAEARQQAEDNLQKALAAGNQMLTRVGEKQLAEVPQMDEVRQKLLEDAVKFYERFVQEGSTDPAVRREIGRAYQGTGRIREQLGKREQAEKDYRQALNIEKILADEFPSKPFFARDLALSHIALGDLCRDQQGRTADAEVAYQSALEILQSLADAHPEIHEVKDSLATAHNNLGLTYRDTSRLALAESAFKMAFDIRSALAQDQPDVPGYREALADSYESLGELYGSRRIARRGKTEADFQKAVAIREQLASDHRKDPAYQNSLAKSYSKLGFYYESNGRIAQAQEPYQEALRIWRQLVSDHPIILEYQTEVALIHGRLGTVCSLTGRKVMGDEHFRQSVDLFERLIHDYPKQIHIALHFADIIESMGVRRRDNNELAEALRCFARSVELAQSVLQKEPQYTEARNRLVTTYMDRAEAYVRLELNQKAIEDWDQMIELGKGPSSPLVQMFAAMARTHRGEHALATATVEALVAEGVEPEYASYNFPCIYSLASAVALKDDRLSALEQKTLADRYAARSVELLQKARTDGFFETLGYVDYLNKDTDFDPLRSRDDFKTLIRQLEEDTKATQAGEHKQ